jgi:hypothetical protein
MPCNLYHFGSYITHITETKSFNKPKKDKKDVQGARGDKARYITDIGTRQILTVRQQAAYTLS